MVDIEGRTTGSLGKSEIDFTGRVDRVYGAVAAFLHWLVPKRPLPL